MIEKEVQLVSELGLHARPCSRIVGGLSKLKLNIAEIHYKSSIAELSSIMNLMALSVSPKGTVLVRLDVKTNKKL